ncbi:MAG: type secretion system protein, partial [Gaiellaceae bacterium]|nr:type secretion system protein [Gaiellaceae bacterium]
MGLHDRIKGGNGSGPGEGNGEAPPIQLVGAPARDPEPQRPHNDPYAELKTRVHHACIAKLGPQLFTTETNEDLHEQVHRAVTEQLALDRTPLTREERRRVVRELTDDILGYRPHEPQRPHNDPYAELKTRVHHACIAKLGPQLFTTETNEDLHEQVHRAVTEQLALDRTPLTREERRRVVRELTDDILGYGPLEPLLRDDDVTEVMVNNFDRIFVERAGKIERTEATFADNAHLLRIIDKIVSQVGRRVDEASPMVDARLPDGSRVNAVIPPLSLKGPTLTIRKFSRDPYTMDDLIAFETLTVKSAQFLAACVRGKLNVLISGGTGTGKTTTLNAVSAFIPGDERIVTIEDAAELQLQQEHVITLESRPPNIEGQGEVRIRELVRNALRMRPDRIIVGEVRGAETLDMLQA